MTPNEVKVIHNGLSNLTTAINELEDIIHPTLMKRLREAKCSIAKGFKPIRDQADKEFDDKANLFDDIKMKNKFSSVWSIYEVDNIYGYSDITVGEDTELVYHNVELYLVGDCRVARGLMGATRDGHKAGNSVGRYINFRKEIPMSSTTVRNIDVDTALKAIKAAREKAGALKVNMSIAVCDAAGHLKAFVRMDGASLISLQIAQDKAHTAISGGLPTHKWHEYIKDDAPLIHGLVHTPRFIIFGGGYPIMENGQMIGGIGLSGGHYSQDMECAEAALKAIGLPD